MTETTADLKPAEKMTVAELRKELEDAGTSVPASAKKADLVELVTQARGAAEAEPEEIEGEVIGEEEDTALVPPELDEEISQALALREAAPQPVMALPTPQEFNAAQKIAEQIAATTFVPESYRGRPNDVVAAILFGREIGLGPMTALRDIHMIDGRPALAAHRQLALLRKGGVVILESETTRERAYIRAQRRDTGEIMAVEFTFEEAEKIRRRGKALVDGDNWRNYPADMLWARAVGRLTRRLGPDLLNGLPPYVAEEVADFSGWGVEYGEGGVQVQQWARDDRPAEERYDYPTGWAELQDRMRKRLGREEADEWLRQAVEIATGTSDPGARSKEQKDVAFQKMLGALRALEEVEGDIAFLPDPRTTVQEVFARFLDGEQPEGPPWALVGTEAETYPQKGQTTLAAVADEHPEEAGRYAPGGDLESGPMSEQGARDMSGDDRPYEDETVGDGSLDDIPF